MVENSIERLGRIGAAAVFLFGAIQMAFTVWVVVLALLIPLFPANSGPGFALSLIVAVVLAIVSGIAYPFIGVGLIRFCEGVRQWASPDESLDNWSRISKSYIAACWPFTMPVLIPIYLTLGVVNRIL